jgi:hypothetical protein
LEFVYSKCIPKSIHLSDGASEDEKGQLKLALRGFVDGISEAYLDGEIGEELHFKNITSIACKGKVRCRLEYGR